MDGSDATTGVLHALRALGVRVYVDDFGTRQPLRLPAGYRRITRGGGGWLCAGGRCAFTGAAGVPYFKDATHLRASFVRCCVKDFDHLVITGK